MVLYALAKLSVPSVLHTLLTTRKDALIAPTIPQPLVDEACILPVEPRCGRPAVGEPVERDVVEDLVACQRTFGMSLKDIRDLRIVVE
jgi:hypothetical protein